MKLGRTLVSIAGWSTHVFGLTVNALMFVSACGSGWRGEYRVP